MTTRQSSFPGVPFPTHAPKFVLPGLSLKQLKANKEVVAKLLELERQGATETPSSDQFYSVIDHSVKIVTLALQRNHPEVTEDQVEDHLDMNNFRTVLACVMGQSGFKLVTSLPEGVAGEQLGEPLSGS